MAEFIATRRTRGRPTSATRQWRSPTQRQGRDPTPIRPAPRSAMRGGRSAQRVAPVAPRFVPPAPRIREEEEEENRIKSVQAYLARKSADRRTSASEKSKLERLARSLEGKKRVSEIPKDVKKDIEKEVSKQSEVIKKDTRLVEMGGLKDIEVRLTPEAESDISTYCTDKFIRENDWAKSPYIDPFMRAVTEEIRKNDDAIVFYTLQVLTRPTKSKRNRSQMFANVNAYVFGDDKSNVRRNRIEDADRLHMAMYLATVTKNILLPRTNTQKKTLDKIKEYARFDRFGSTTKAVIDGTVNKCKRAFRKVEGDLLKKRDVNCSVKDWIEVYMLFPEGALRRAVMNVVFDSSS